MVEDDFDKASEEIHADISFARATKTTLLKEQNLHRTAALDAHSNYQTAKENYEKNFVNKECLAEPNSICGTDETGAATFCKCQEALSSELLTLAKPLLISTGALMGLEVILLVSCLILCCIGRRHKQQPALDLEGQPGDQYLQPGYFYVQHASVAPKGRASTSNSDVVAVTQSSQAISLV